MGKQSILKFDQQMERERETKGKGATNVEKQISGAPAHPSRQLEATMKYEVCECEWEGKRHTNSIE